MNVVEVPISGNIYTDALVEGLKWNTTTLDFAFPTSPAQYSSYPSDEPQQNFETLNSAQKIAVRAALSQVSSFANLTFSELTGSDVGSATLRFGMSDGPPTAYAYLPAVNAIGGDAWFNNSSGLYDNPVLGNYAYVTFLHEVGHTLGLGHPHEATPVMAPDRDNLSYTVMSYNSAYGALGYQNGIWDFPQSYMMEDISALQFMYGANYNFHALDNVYVWDFRTGEMSVDGIRQGRPGGDRIFETIWDGGGNDTYDFSNYLSSVTVDLAPGAWSQLSFGQTANLGGPNPGSIANALLYHDDARSLIENAVGTPVSDIIRGNLAGNRLDGGNGADKLYGLVGKDILIGNLGPDLLDGGEGVDAASYADDNGAVFVNLTLGQGYGNAAQGDTYISIENVIGTSFNDFLIGDTGANRLDGSGGDDILIGALGADVLVGGSGIDWASYEDNSGAVFVNLTLNAGSNNAAQDDTYDGIENLKGGLFDDFFIGNELANRLEGAMGADTLLGAGGADTFVFTYAPGATSTWGKANVDTILDFTSGTDKIELAASAFSGLAAGALNPAAFVVGSDAVDANDRIIYNQATGHLLYDADGSGAGAAGLFAILDTKLVIQASDFVIV